jgi:peroxiredoxin
LHSSPAGWSTLARNAVLATLAAFVVLRGYGGTGPSALSWAGDLSTAGLLGLLSGLVVLALVGFQWWFLLHLLRQNGRLLMRVQALEAKLGGASAFGNGSQAAGLPVGSLAPAFGLRDLRGEEVTLEDLRTAQKPVVLLFTSPECGPCTDLLPEVGRWHEEHSEELTISLVSHLSAEENRAKVAEHGLEDNVLLQEDWEVAETYGSETTPSAVLIWSDGTIGSPLVKGSDAVGELIAHVIAGHAQLPMLYPNGAHAAHEAAPQGPKVGELAPEVGLPDLEGKNVSLEDFRDEEALLLFWSPSCGHCQNMLPELKEWETNPARGAPKLIVVSDGTVEANRAQGFRSPVVLDEGYRVSDAYGVPGTPSAVLVDVEGRVASTVTAGAPAVMRLAEAR